MKFPVLEMFVSIQGEGRFTGSPSLFIRLGGCNLRCVFGCSRCDTPYSSFELEKPICSTVEEAQQMAGELLAKNKNVKHIVITGGEPLLYKNALQKFLSNGLGEYVITIETNGTLEAISPFEDDNTTVVAIDLWSVSPKLSTSVDKELRYLSEEQRDRHDKTRINIKNLSSYWRSMRSAWLNYDMQPDLQFKFVYSGEESVIEIKEIIDKLSDEISTSRSEINKKVMLMPEGTTNEQLTKISQECAEVCIREGWTFCDRLHIRIWGDKRGV